jgi:DNA-binding GntR family transcriptional regulator
MAEEAASARMDSEIEFRSRPRVFRKDEAYAIIRDFLLGEESDQILSERILAGHLGLGLGPVRSALERLRAEGLIVAAPNSGLRLPEVTAKEIIDFYEMRMVVECHIASAVAGRLTGEQSDRLEDILFDQERSAATRDTVRYHQLDLDFHQALVDCHGNSEMARALGQMRDKMYRLSRRLHRAHPERLAVNAAQHRSIVDAIRAGSGAEARARMDTHLTWGRAFTLDPDGRLSRS